MLASDWVRLTQGSEYTGSASVIPSAPRPRGGGEPEEAVRCGGKRIGLGARGLGAETSSASNCCVTLGKSISISSCQFLPLENGEIGMLIPVLSCYGVVKKCH